MEIATSTNILCERTKGSPIDVETSIRMCAGAGYRLLDLCFVDQVSQKTEFLSEDWKSYILSLGELASSCDIVFVQAHAPIHDFCRAPGTGFGTDEGTETLVMRSIEGAGMLGIPWLVMHPSTGVKEGRQDPKTHEANVGYFQKMADYGKLFGVGIAIENMWGKTKEGIPRYAIQAEELRHLIEDVGRDNVGACWDTEHGSIEGLDQKHAIRLLAPFLRATHISDQTAGDNIHILPYTGFTDWDEVLEAFGEADYAGAFAFEIQHYLWSMPLELLPEAVAFSYKTGMGMMETLNTYRRQRR